MHPNPGPLISSLKFCHWNLNSILARNSIKLSLIEAYDSIHKFDLIALSETYLNNSISNEDIPLQGFSHNVFRSDHPSNAKRGGVCLYYKEKLSIKQRPDLQILSECVVAEITSNRKKIFFVVLYRSHSQSFQQFKQFLDGVESMISNIKTLKPHCLVITGDFNCRSSKWWAEDNENLEGMELNDLLDSLNMSRVINQPTHVRLNTHSCIELILTEFTLRCIKIVGMISFMGLLI